jgi:hypothetical protein
LFGGGQQVTAAIAHTIKVSSAVGFSSPLLFLRAADLGEAFSCGHKFQSARPDARSWVALGPTGTGHHFFETALKGLSGYRQRMRTKCEQPAISLNSKE